MRILKDKRLILDLDPARFCEDWHTGKQGDILKAIACEALTQTNKPPHKIPRVITFGNQRYCVTGGSYDYVHANPLLPPNHSVQLERFTYAGTQILFNSMGFRLGKQWTFKPRMRTIEEVRYKIRTLYGYGGCFLTLPSPTEAELERMMDDHTYSLSPKPFPSYHEFLHRDMERMCSRTLAARETTVQEAVAIELQETPNHTTQEQMQDFLDQGPVTQPTQLSLI